MNAQGHWKRLRIAGSVGLLSLIGVAAARGQECRAELLQELTDCSGNFGFASAMSGDTLVVGAPTRETEGRTDSGAACVFVPGRPFQELTSGDVFDGDNFGYAVAIDGDTIVVGEWRDGQRSEGAAFVFVRVNNVWERRTKLVSNFRDAEFEFGSSVGVSGGTVVVGAHRDWPDVIRSAGAAYVFLRPPGGWPNGNMTECVQLLASDRAADDNFGTSVDVDGHTIVVGAPLNDDSGPNSGWCMYSKSPITDGNAAVSWKRPRSSSAAEEVRRRVWVCR